MAAKSIGDQGRLIVERMAARRWGVLAVEVQERLGVSYWAARRFLLKLTDEGTLKRDGHRRRTEVYERCHGVGGVVFRLVRRKTVGPGQWTHRRGGSGGRPPVGL